MHSPGGLIRPLATRGMPPLGMLNGPPPPGDIRPRSRGDGPGSLPPPSPLMRSDISNTYLFLHHIYAVKK